MTYANLGGTAGNKASRPFIGMGGFFLCFFEEE